MMVSHFLFGLVLFSVLELEPLQQELKLPALFALFGLAGELQAKLEGEIGFADLQGVQERLH